MRVARNGSPPLEGFRVCRNIAGGLPRKGRPRFEDAAEDLLVALAYVARVDPKGVNDAVCCYHCWIAAESDDVAEAIDACVFPENLSVSGIAARAERLRPATSVTRTCAREPGLLPARVAARVVEASPQTLGSRVETCDGPESISVDEIGSDVTAPQLVKAWVKNCYTNAVPFPCNGVHNEDALSCCDECRVRP